MADQTRLASGHSPSFLCTATSAGPDAEQCLARVLQEMLANFTYFLIKTFSEGYK